MIYAGIGSRQTPPSILDDIRSYSKKLTKLGYNLRTGGAVGADSAFEDGCKNGFREIYTALIPKTGRWHIPNCVRYFGASAGAHLIASKFHPVWEQLTEVQKKYIARNVHILLGIHLNEPVDFVLAYTAQEDAKRGGTYFTMTVARAAHIPVYNIYKPKDLKRFKKEILQEAE